MKIIQRIKRSANFKCYILWLLQKAVPDHISTKEIEQPVQQPPAPKKVALSPSGSGSRIVKAPRFVIPLEGKMVDEGERNLSLKCKVDGNLFHSIIYSMIYSNYS